MPIPAEYNFIRYLAAKKSADDRALNHQVREALRRTLAGRACTESLRVLEVGCGIGTMVERLVDWGFLREAHYTGLDLDAENIAAARRRLRLFAARKGFGVQEEDSRLKLTGPQASLGLAFEACEVLSFAARQAGRTSWDLLLAHAFLDLVDLDEVLPPLLGLLTSGGWFYFTLNFDGATVFYPANDLDRQIAHLYHRTMGRGRPGGGLSDGSTTGRRLFGALRGAGAEVLAAGSSDWVVFPQGGCYPEDEAYFLHFILHTIQEALADHPDLDRQAFGTWINERHAQVEAGELVYLAHQLDFFGRVL